MGSTRALITELEREQIAGKHGDERRYQAVSRVRRRIKEQLIVDVQVLRQYHPQLLEELREVVNQDRRSLNASMRFEQEYLEPVCLPNEFDSVED